MPLKGMSTLKRQAVGYLMDRSLDDVRLMVTTSGEYVVHLERRIIGGEKQEFIVYQGKDLGIANKLYNAYVGVKE